MFRSCMSQIPVWSVRSHLVLRAPVLVPVSLGPHPKNFGHWQNSHQNPSQWSLTCSSDQICRKYYSWFGPPGYKKICQTNLGKVPDLMRTVKSRYWRCDISAYATATYNRPTFVMTDKHKNDHVPRYVDQIFLESARNKHFHDYLLNQERYQKYFLTLIEGKEWNQYYNEMISKQCMFSLNKVLRFYISFVRGPEHLLTRQKVSYLKTLCKFTLFPKLKIQEIWCLMRHLFAVTKQNNYNKTVTVLFKNIALMAVHELLKRVDTLSSEEIFKTADMLFLVGMYRQNPLMKVLVQKMMNQVTTEHQVTEQEVLFFFYMGLDQFSVPETSERIMDQHRLLTISENLHINEVGIICSGLFRAKVTLHCEKFGLHLLEKLKENIGCCHDVTISMILKFLTYTCDRRLTEKFPAIYSTLTDRDFTSMLAHFVSDVKVTELPGSSVYRIIRLYSSIQFGPEVIIDSAVKKTLESAKCISKTMRLKDLTDFVFRISTFPNCDENARQFFQLLTEEIMRRMDLQEMLVQKGKFRIELAHYLIGLFVQDIYPFQLIELLFTERTSLKEKLGGQFDCYSRLLYSISESVKIERPEYNGPLFKGSFADVCRTLRNWEKRDVERFHFRVETDNPTLRGVFTYAVEEALEHYLGDRQYFTTHMFMPHLLKYDIGFAVNETGDVIPASEWITPKGQIKQDKSIRRIAVVLELDKIAMFTCMDRDGNLTKSVGGTTKMRFRQLQRMGYEVVPIFHDEFFGVEDRQKFLEQKLPSFNRKPETKILQQH